jgi:5-formyltetrahydrofolate cyclo-ligase
MPRRDLSGEWSAIREHLRGVALTDSRFDLDLDQFIPGFAGLELATARLTETPAFISASTLFVTPDNSMQVLRWKAIEAGKTLLVPSYGLRRGFLRIRPEAVPHGDALYASWGDGLMHFGERVAVGELASVGRLDAVAAGAAAVSRNGLRFGMGHRYLDLEWNMFRKVECIASDAPVWTIVHDCQVIDSDEAGDDDNVVASGIFTPTRAIKMSAQRQPERVRRSVFRALYGTADVPGGLMEAVTLAE